MAKRIQVGGRIESMEVGGIVTGAAEILDDAKGKKQSVVNQETDDELARLDQSKQDNLTFDNAPTEDSNNPVKSGGVYAADKALSDAIEAILLLIPSAASALNKLVDTSMMNSSISTATATFRGTYNVVTDLSLTVDATHEQIAAKLAQMVSEADNNDYAFVQIPVSAESTDIRRTERYKFNGTAWGYEYDLNTSGFTAAQWAAINSGITLALVGKLIGLPTSLELQALLGQKQDTLTFDNVPTAGSANPVKSGGVHTAINDEKTAREQLAQTVTDINGRVGNIEEVIPTGAAANNKLVANNSMEAYVTSIIEAITASFTIATADGHISLTLTQTNGRVASLTLTSSDIASDQALTELTGRVSTTESNITTLGGRVSTNETDIANLQQLYNNLQQSKPVPVTALPETGQQQGVIYRLAGTTSYSDYMWNGSTWVLMATYNNAIDPRPKKASQNLVTSGGVFDNMGALDVSELNATENPHTIAQYVDLSAALAAIPTDYQKGGMSIKFVHTSDNKYVQYRLMAQTFSTDEADWQGVDDVSTAGSDNLVKSGGVYNSFFKVYSEIFSCLQKNLNIFIKNMNLQSSSSSPSVVNYDGYYIDEYGELQAADPASYKVRKLNVSPGEIYYIKKFGAGVGISDLAFYSGGTCKGIVSYFSDNVSAYIIVPTGIDSVYVQILNNVPSEEFTIYEMVGDYSFIFNLLKNAMREIPTLNKYSITERSEYILLQNGTESTFNQAISSGLYPFNPENKYVYNGDVEYSINPVAYYDIYGNIIGFESVEDGLVTDYELTNIPSGTVALRFCSWSDMNVVVSSAASEQIEKIPQLEDAIDIVDDCTVVGYSRGTDITSHATKYENKFFDTSTGSMSTIDGFSVYMMSVSPGEVYEVAECVSYLAIYAYILLDGNGNVIDRFPRNETPGPVYYNENIVIPNKAVTLVVHEYTGVVTHPVSIYQSSKREILSADACLVGMKWVCVGDSLTEINNTSTKFYHEYVKEATGINVVNMGASGTGYKRGEDGNNAFYQRILNIPLDADVITIFGSGNDNPYWRDNLGTAWDTGTSTIGGCINTTLDNLYSIMPLANVALVTPTPWKGTEPYYFGQEHTNWFEKYCELIVEICKIRGIPCLDLFHESGLRPSIEAVRQMAYSRDGDNGVHPNEIGHKLIAPRFKMLVESMLI